MIQERSAGVSYLFVEAKPMNATTHALGGTDRTGRQDRTIDRSIVLGTRYDKFINTDTNTTIDNNVLHTGGVLSEITRPRNENITLLFRLFFCFFSFFV